jgi:hypothetical protein
MVQQNLRKHEIIGLFYQFLGATSVGIGMYYAVWAGVRSVYYKQIALVSGSEWLLFPLLFGVGAVLWSLGVVELKEAQPGYGVKR